MKFDKDFEEDILSKVLNNTNFLKRASRVLESHHFSTKYHSWVWETVGGIWKKYRERATPKLMLSRARFDFPKDEEREHYLRFVKKLYKRKGGAASASLDELVEFVQAVEAQISMEVALGHLEKGKIKEVYKEVRKLSRVNVEPRDYTEIKWSEEFSERQRDRKRAKEHPGEMVVVPTGFKRLDRVITGLQLGELGIFLATTGKGKSIMLVNVAFHAVKLGIPTVYFSLEMPARQIAARTDSRWSGMEYNKFKEFDFAPSELRTLESKHKRSRKRFQNMFRIISMPLRKCDSNKIRGALDDLRDDGFEPKQVLIDSGDHMNSVEKYESYRLSQASVYWDLKTMAEEDGYAIWSSTHAGREWAKSTATSEAAGESYDKSRIADIVCSLNTPERKSRSTKVVLEDGEEEDFEEESRETVGEYVELHIAKYRDGASRITIPMDAQFSKMLIQEIE